MTQAKQVLFLCTGNSARSVMAEALLNFHGMGRFKAYSAGSHPSGAINPFTIDTLKIAKMPVDGLRSKSWDEFSAPGAPKLDFVFTVCDNAAGEVCPAWPGQPMTAHWGFPDPVVFQGADIEKRAFFQEIFRQIRTRIELFISLPLQSLDQLSLQRKLDEMGGKIASPTGLQ